VGRCDYCVMDPPYLSIDTLRAFFVSARLLAKPDGPQGEKGKEDGTAPPCIVVTGACVCVCA